MTREERDRDYTVWWDGNKDGWNRGYMTIKADVVREAPPLPVDEYDYYVDGVGRSTVAGRFARVCETRRDEALRLLEDGPATVAQLMEHTGLCFATLYEHLRNKIDEGIVSKFRTPKILGQMGRRPDMYQLVPA